MEGRSIRVRRILARRRAVTPERSAFTLIEMVVVTAIIALMAALILPNLVALERSQSLRATEAAILRLPAEARVEAMRSHAPVIMRVDGDALVLERVVVDTQDTATQTGQGGPVPMVPPDPLQSPDVESVKRLELGSDISVDTLQQNGQSMDAATWKWVVYPDGSAESAGITFVIGGDRHTLWIPATNPDGGSGISVNNTGTGGFGSGGGGGSANPNVVPGSTDPQWIAGEIPDTSNDSWSAGDLEQRQQGAGATGGAGGG